MKALAIIALLALGGCVMGPGEIQINVGADLCTPDSK